MVLMFTDMVNSSGLKVKLGDAAYAASIAKPHNDLFRRLLAEYPGARELNYAGDGFLASFRRVSDAVKLALRFHHGLRTWPWQVEAVQTRIGIHVGEATLLDKPDDREMSIASHAADVCARVMGLGSGGQTLLTRHAFDDARQYVREHPPVSDGGAPPALAWAAHGRYRFKGKDEDPLEVFEVGVVGLAPLDAPPDSEKARRVLNADEEETLGWRPASNAEIPGKPGWVTQQKLGEGGFGEVWLARQSKTGHQRVFKFCFDPDRLRSLKRELTIFRLIRESLGDREDIARLHDVRLDKPPFYLESDFVESGNLAQWAERKGGMDRVPPETRWTVLAGICKALAAAHSVGVIHKDIKPSNVFMREDPAGRAWPVLADFGIGIVMDRSELDRLGITGAGLTMSVKDSTGSGTRLYAPPECLVGKPATVQGDVFALGVMLYQFAVGDLHRPLATGWERDVEDPVLREDIAAATAGRLEERLASVNDLLARLESAPTRRRAARRKRLVRRCALAAAGLALVAGIGALVLKSSRGDRVNQLTAQLQQRLDALSWSGKAVAEADRFIAGLEQIAPQTAADFRQRLAARLADAISRAIFRSNLAERDRAEIGKLLALLEPRDATRAAQLRRELDQRLRQWTQVYALQPPFAKDAGLPAPPAPDAAHLQLASSRLALPVRLGASARVDAEFRPAPGARSSAGLGFEETAGRGYAFRIASGASPKGAGAATRIELDPSSKTLEERMSGWSCYVLDAASVIIENGRPILRVENNNPQRAFTTLAKEFEAARHRGKRWRVAFRYRLSQFEPYPKSGTYNPQAQLIVGGALGDNSRLFSSKVVNTSSNCDWKDSVIEFEVPAEAQRVGVRLSMINATGRFDIADLRITETDTGAAKGTAGIEVLAQPRQPWTPESDTAQAWMPNCDSRNITFHSEDGRRFLRLRSDGVGRVPPNNPMQIISRVRIDPMETRSVSLKARVRVTDVQPSKAIAAQISVVPKGAANPGGTGTGLFRDLVAKPGWQDVEGRLSRLPSDTEYLDIGLKAGTSRGTLDVSRFVVELEPVTTSSEDAGTAKIIILRDGRVLRERAVALPADGTAGWKLSAERDGGMLRFAFGNQPPIEAFDAFPLVMTNAQPVVTASRGSLLRSLTAFEQSLPAKPNPLEVGDELFNAGRFVDARAAYESQLATAADADTRAEARCKAGLCLLELKRPAEAESVLVEAAKSGVSSWSLVAGCRLWERYLVSQRITEADAVLQTLKARPDFAQIASCATPSLRTNIVQRYVDQYRSTVELAGPPEWRAAADRLGQLVELVEPLDLPITARYTALWHINRFYECDRQTERAYAQAEETLKEIEADYSATIRGQTALFCDSYARMATLKGRTEDALQAILRFDARDPLYRFALHAARCLVTLKQLDRAQEKVTPLISAKEPFRPVQGVDPQWVEAVLLHGLIVEMQRGSEAARQVWADAFRKLRQSAPDGRPTERIEGSRRELVYLLIFASLSGELRDEDVSGTQKKVVTLYGSLFGGSPAKKAILESLARNFDRQALTEMWQSERGAAFARRYALSQVPFPDAYRMPVTLAVEQLLVQGSIGRDKATAEETAIYSRLTDELMETFRKQEAGAPLGMALAGAWNGLTSLFGWDAVRSELPPSLRGPVAFMLGHRYVKLGKKEEAAEMFRAAQKEASEARTGGPLPGLADKALKQLAN